MLCLICGNEVEPDISWTGLFSRAEEYEVCGSCNKKLERIEGEQCRICGRPFTENEQKFRAGDLCGDCRKWKKDAEWGGVLTRNSSLYVYNDFLKEVIARFKYRGDYILAKAFGEQAAIIIKQLKPDIIVPIPLSPERLYERGFNQAEAILAAAGIQSQLLLARVHGEKQSKKSRRERIHLAQVFRVSDPIGLDGKKILLIDDIYTTGSTLRHAAKLLKEAGAAEVSSLTIARG